MRISDWSSDVCSSDLCVDPTAEDRMWFPDIAGSGNPDAVMKDIWANYRDESFITQFLSQHLMRPWKLFKLLDEEKEPALAVEDWKSVVEGKSVSVRVDRGGRRILKKKKKRNIT